MNNDSNPITKTNINMSIAFSTNNSMNINHNIINNTNEVSKSQNQKLPSNYMNNNNNKRPNDFINLSNSLVPTQNKYINMPEHNLKIKNRNKNDYSPFLRENKKNEKNNNIPNANLNFERNVNNSAGFMNLNIPNKKQLLEFDKFSNVNINHSQNQNPNL
jgi:hypothetical protein